MALLAGLALAGAAPAGAQAPVQGGEAAPRFDCSRARDPKGCEERVAKLRAAREKARQACEGKAGAERRDCMVKAFCAEAQDPARCETMLKERAASRTRK